MIVELANSYILALNSGQIPNIENAWTNVCNFESERAFKDAMRYYQEQVKTKIRDCWEDIGFLNIKPILNSIKSDSL